jgi:hypothetical protein
MSRACHPRVIYLCDCGSTTSHAHEAQRETPQTSVASANALQITAHVPPTISAATTARNTVQNAQPKNQPGTDDFDLSKLEGVQHAKKTMLDLATQVDPISQERYENIALKIIRAASKAANALSRT